MKLAELLALQRDCHGDERLEHNLGDGYLYLNNPFYRRIRHAALERGFVFTKSDSCGYFGFPLSSLDEVLELERIPYRDNFTALGRLEAARPGFFTLADLRHNRPTPNYVLHEAAHAVAFRESFGRPRRARRALGQRENLFKVMLGEAFAMTAEYLAACSCQAGVGRWLFDINSYRHRTQAKQAIGELIVELGLARVVWGLLGAFLYSNYLRDSMRQRDLDRWLEAQPSPSPPLSPKHRQRLAHALSQAMKMSLEFRLDTAKLFLGKLGYPRNIARLLATDPRDAALEADLAACERLVSTLTQDALQ